MASPRSLVMPMSRSQKGIVRPFPRERRVYNPGEAFGCVLYLVGIVASADDSGINELSAGKMLHCLQVVLTGAPLCCVLGESPAVMVTNVQGRAGASTSFMLVGGYEVVTRDELSVSGGSLRLFFKIRVKGTAFRDTH